MSKTLLPRHHLKIHFATEWAIFLLVLMLNVPELALSGEATIGSEVTVETVKSENLCQNEHYIIEKLEVVKKYLQSEQYQDAISILKDVEYCSIVNDIVLYWKGASLMGLSPQEAAKTFAALIDQCADSGHYLENPCSPSILKKAKMTLIELKLLNQPEEAIRLLQQYVETYPSDDYAIYLLSYIKKQLGADVTDLYKKLYIKNSNLCRFFQREISINILSHEEAEEKIRDLIKKVRYDEAETAIKTRLKTERDLLKRESLFRLLGYVYFRQKRYKEAIEPFQISKEYYMLGLSYLRAGLLEYADKIIQKLINSRDRRVVSLAIGYARILRDLGEYQASIEYLKELLKHFPYDAEQIQWAIAWTNYRLKNYDEAFRILKSLSEKYKDIRYEYWLLKILEIGIGSSEVNSQSVGGESNKSGSVSISDRYRAIAEKGDGIYSILAMHRSRPVSGLTITSTTGVNSYIEKVDSSSRTINGEVTVDALNNLFRRFSIFLRLDLKDELSDELTFLVNRCLKEDTGNSNGIIKASNGDRRQLSGENNSRDICYNILYEIGRFYFRTDQPHRAVSLYTRLKTFAPLKKHIDDSLIYPVIFSDIIKNVSTDYGIDPFLLLAAIREESRYNPEAVSPVGAMGLMQIMLPTAKRLISKSIGSTPANLIDSIFKPEFNIRLGAMYLKSLIEKYNGVSYAIAAYNAGESAVEEWLKNNYSSEEEFIEDIPYGETRNYVKRVLSTYQRYLSIYRK